MTSSTLYFAAQKVEKNALRLAEIAQELSVGGVAMLRAAEAKFAYMRHGSERSDGFTEAVEHEVSIMRRDYSRTLEAEAIDLYLSLEAEAAVARARAAEARPHRDESTPAAIMLSREQWEAVRALVERGRGLGSIIATASVDRVLAIEAFAPEWEESQKAPVDPETDREAARDIRERIESQVTARLIEVGDEATSRDLALARRTEGWARFAEIWVEYLRKAFSGSARGSERLDYAISASLVLREYGITPSASEKRAGANQAHTEHVSEKVGRSRWPESSYVRV